jgi:integrase
VAKQRKSRKCWSKSVGEYGYRVRVYELYPGSNLYRSVWQGGKEDKQTLGHKDRELAVLQALQLIAHLRSMGREARQGEITLGALRVRYVASKAHAAKKERTRIEDERKLERVVAYLGPALRASALDEERILAYIVARRSGEPGLLHVRERTSAEGQPAVRNRTIEADLVALRTMLHWAAKVRNDQGQPLLASDPLKGITFPKEQNPRRPIVNEDDYQDLLAAAGAVHPLLPVGLTVSNGTGRRLSAWRQLRWRDVRFDREQYGAIQWPGETDKNGLALLRPITPEVRDALLSIRPPNPDPDAYVFPSPGNPRKPLSKRRAYTWLRKAYGAAGLVPEAGGMWHPVRRKWTTERKGYPLADIAAAGGWKDERSLKSYLQEDPDTVRKVVLEPTHQLRRGAGTGAFGQESIS